MNCIFSFFDNETNWWAVPAKVIADVKTIFGEAAFLDTVLQVGVQACIRSLNNTYLPLEHVTLTKEMLDAHFESREYTMAIFEDHPKEALVYFRENKPKIYDILLGMYSFHFSFLPEDFPIAMQNGTEIETAGPLGFWADGFSVDNDEENEWWS